MSARIRIVYLSGRRKTIIPVATCAQSLEILTFRSCRYPPSRRLPLRRWASIPLGLSALARSTRGCSPTHARGKERRRSSTTYWCRRQSMSSGTCPLGSRSTRVDSEKVAPFALCDDHSIPRIYPSCIHRKVIMRPLHPRNDRGPSISGCKGSGNWGWDKVHVGIPTEPVHR